MKVKRIILLVVIIVVLSGVIFIINGMFNKPTIKLGLSEMLSSQLLSDATLVSDDQIKLENLPKEITKDQVTEIKKYRLGSLLVFRVGRASQYFPYYGHYLDQATFQTLPSGIFVSADNGKSWSEIISSDSLPGHKSTSGMTGLLEPSGVFVHDKKLFVDFAEGSAAEGYLIRLSTTDYKTWTEVGCYSMIPEKYNDPFSLDPSYRCIKTDSTLDNWIPAGQKPSIEVNQAREILLAYLGALNMGWYEEAVALYAGNQLDTLRYWNPDTNITDISALFNATCHRQTICTFPFTVTPAKIDKRNSIYNFDVVLPLGETAPGVTKKFTYTVKASSDGKYTVESLPGYVQ
jgi:hypothetical protein